MECLGFIQALFETKRIRTHAFVAEQVEYNRWRGIFEMWQLLLTIFRSNGRAHNTGKVTGDKYPTLLRLTEETRSRKKDRVGEYVT